MTFIKHFGEKSQDYLRFRPEYSENLFAYLSGLVKEHDLAWDCGTGNGQAAVKLAEYFKNVIGTDINQAQLDVAMRRHNVHYDCCKVENTNIPSACVDLIAVAQSVHWFDLEKFYAEVKRVGKPESMVAVWCYSLGNISPEIDPIVLRLYNDILGSQYWPKERKYVDEAYQTLPFPFQKIQTPTFAMEKKINYFELIGYLQTWSAVKEYVDRNHKSPLDFIYADLQKAWGNPTSEHTLQWQINMLAGKVHHQ